MKQPTQGDLLFYPVKLRGPVANTMGIDDRQLAATKKLDTNVIALGEKTGHKHILTGGFLFNWESSNTNYLHLFVEESGGSVTHDEHPPLKLAPGVYRVLRQRVHDYKFSHQRKVED